MSIIGLSGFRQNILTPRICLRWRTHSLAMLTGRVSCSPELRPSHAETHFNKGTMERAAGNLAAAAADFGRVLKLAPDHLGALNNRSLTLQRLQRFEEALSDSDRLVVLAPADPVVHNNRGALLHEMMMPSPIMTVPSPSTPISPRPLSTRASRFCFRVSLRLAGSCGSGAGNKQG